MLFAAMERILQTRPLKIALLEAKMYTEREGREILFLFLFTRLCNRRTIIKTQEKACLNVRKFEH